MRLAIALLATMLAACSTPYQEMGFDGGVSAVQMTDTTFRVSARGNGFTSPTAVQDFVMLKAAETAQQHGANYFEVISAADATRNTTIVTGGASRTTFVGNTAMTTYTPPTATNVVKPGQDAYIRIYRIAQGEQAPAGAISADEIIRHVGTRLRPRKAS
jgi:hypothetical protein